MIGRTHGQHGLPITFGFKVAGWGAELVRHCARLRSVEERLGVVQLSGGVGSVSSLGAEGLAVQQRFAEILGMRTPDISWTSSRDVFTEWCALLALIGGTADRIEKEIYNLSRTEIAELSEGDERFCDRQHHHAAQAQSGGRGKPWNARACGATPRRRHVRGDGSRP